MMNNFAQILLDYFVDYIFMAFGYPFIWTAQLINATAEFLFFQAPATLFVIFLGSVFRDSKSPFYWKKIKRSPVNVIEAALSHEVFLWFAKGYVNLVLIILMVLAVLSSLSVIGPTEEGMHVRDMMQDPNIRFEAFSTFVILSLCAIGFKVIFYTMLGITKSYGDFKLKMIFR